MKMRNKGCFARLRLKNPRRGFGNYDNEELPSPALHGVGCADPLPGLPEELKQTQVVVRSGLHFRRGSGTPFFPGPPQPGGGPFLVGKAR